MMAEIPIPTNNTGTAAPTHHFRIVSEVRDSAAMPKVETGMGGVWNLRSPRRARRTVGDTSGARGVEEILEVVVHVEVQHLPAGFAEEAVELPL